MLPFQVPAAHAEGQFATSEVVVNGVDGAVVLSFGASNQLEFSSDDDDPISVSFNGFLLTPSSERVTPVTVRILDAVDREPPTIAEFAEKTGQIQLANQATFRSDIAEIEVEKSVYLVSLPDSERFGSITITDDPAPVVIGLLTFASVVSFQGLFAYLAANETCTERLELTVSVDLSEPGGSASFVCIKSE